MKPIVCHKTFSCTPPIYCVYLHIKWSYDTKATKQTGKRKKISQS